MVLLDHNTQYVYVVRSELRDPAMLEEWNAWYEDEHIPKLLSVPGLESATRYKERGAGRYLATYEIESPAVFEEPRYKEVTGWGEWEQHVKEWRRAIYKLDTKLPGSSPA